MGNPMNENGWGDTLRYIEKLCPGAEVLIKGTEFNGQYPFIKVEVSHSRFRGNYHVRPSEGDSVDEAFYRDHLKGTYKTFGTVSASKSNSFVAHLVRGISALEDAVTESDE